jgi:hypothetical protein
VKSIRPEPDPRNALASELVNILSDAIAMAVTRPGVIEALRQAFATERAEVAKTEGLTKIELAKRLGKSTSTIDRLDREPGAPFHYVGDRRVYDLHLYSTWLAGRGKRPTTPAPSNNEIDIDDVASGAGLRVAK